MKNGLQPFGDGFVRMQAALDGLNRQFKQSATLEVGWDDRTNYPDGTPVGKIAKVQEFGAVINHPGGTRYITDAVISKRKKLFMATRFVGPEFVGDALRTKAHQIIIPARPFIRPTIAEHEPQWRAEMKERLAKGETLEAAMEAMGLTIASQIQKQIASIHTPPLAPSTIRKRLSRGFAVYGNATKPLIDTGTMLRTIRSQVTMGPLIHTETEPAPSPGPSPAPKAPRQTIWNRVVNFGKRLFGR